MKPWPLIGLLTLSACATAPCEPRLSPGVPYPVPTPVACVDASKVPVEPATITLDPDARIGEEQAAKQANDLRIWGRSLYALIIPGCTR